MLSSESKMFGKSAGNEGAGEDSGEAVFSAAEAHPAFSDKQFI